MVKINNSSAIAENIQTTNSTVKALPKPKLNVQTSNEKIYTIEEIIEANFRLPIDTNNGCKFFIQNNTTASMTIPTEVYRILRSLYLTVGRLPAEMEALCYLQMFVISNIVNFTTTSAALDKLQTTRTKSPVVESIVKCLTRLCTQEM